MQSFSSPQISIITVTYNAAKVLEPTILSIIGQQFRDFEYIIMDGASTDSTLEIIHKYANHITYWRSEPDKGLYDAMNKGLKVARGKYVWFMNAGDEIYSSETLQRIFSQSQQADVYYGDALLIDSGGKTLGLRSEVTPHKLPKQLTWQSLQYGMVVCHQSFIAKREITPFYKLTHPYSADVDWEIQCLKNAREVQNTGLILCKYLTGGFSKKHLYRSLTDRFQVLQAHFGTLATVKNHLWIIIRGFLFVWKRKKGY